MNEPCGCAVKAKRNGAKPGRAVQRTRRQHPHIAQPAGTARLKTPKPQHHTRNTGHDTTAALRQTSLNALLTQQRTGFLRVRNSGGLRLDDQNAKHLSRHQRQGIQPGSLFIRDTGEKHTGHTRCARHLSHKDYNRITQNTSGPAPRRVRPQNIPCCASHLSRQCCYRKS